VSDPLAHPEAVALAEEIASAARHDLRNRLAAIRGAMYYLQRRFAMTELWDSDPRVPQFITVIGDEVERATLVLAERLTLSQLYTRRVARVDVEECARLAIEHARLRGRTDLSLVVDAAPQDAAPASEGGTVRLPWGVTADRNELALALRCLVENAAEAIEGAGTITVRIRPTDPGLQVQILDTGPGFQGDAARCALDPYFTTKEGHAGLGLNIVQRICKRYGGTVTLGEPDRRPQVTLSFLPSRRQAP
jgi:signal transduction histidine kinase